MEGHKIDLDIILKECRSISDVSRVLFNNSNYNSRRKAKKILLDNNVDLEEWLNGRTKKFCKYCGKEITGKGRSQKTFCNHSCAASYNNHKRENGDNFCLNCGKKICSKNKFCNNSCFSKYKKKEYIKKWKNGEVDGISGSYGIIVAVKEYIYEKNDNKCECCGKSFINPYTNKSILQIHHLDGDCKNNKEENLQLLCPNCHAMTENYGSRNKNATRKDKRKRF